MFISAASGVGASRRSIRGHVTALTYQQENHGDGWILLSSCDRVILSAGCVLKLVANTNASARIVAFHDGCGWEPLFTLYHTQLIAEIRQRLRENRLALLALFDEGSVQRIPTSINWPKRLSVNRPSELAQIAGQLEKIESAFNNP